MNINTEKEYSNARFNRTELKACAKRTFKSHYVLFVIVCLFAAFIGAEFSTTLSAISTGIETGEQVAGNGTELVSDGFWITNSDIFEFIVTTAVRGNIEESRKRAAELEAEFKNSPQNSTFGRRRGVFSSIINYVGSGKIFVNLFERGERIFKSKSKVIVVFILIAILIHMLILFMLKDCFVITTRRIFLEAGTYEKVPKRTLLFLIRTRTWVRSALTMFVVFVRRTLWYLTIVAIPIKYYSYFLVPYILSENPSMSASEAISLSRRLMNGHKWECFKISVSFIPWRILSMFTFGLLSVLYVNPYKTATYCEFYKRLRFMSKYCEIEGSELLNDTYLYEKPTPKELSEVYADVMEYVGTPLPEVEELGGFKGFLEKWFGIMPLGSKKDLEHEKKISVRNNILRIRHIVDGGVYSERLSPIKERRAKIKLTTPSYLRNYSIPSLILMFFVFSFVGWLWEVSIHLVEDGEIINRGTCYGPWLPIYGSGAILILIFLKRLRSNAALEFVAAIIMCGIVEYWTSWYLDSTRGQQWWNYSGYFINLNGRICAEGLLAFGLGAMAVVYVLAPLLDNMIRKIKPGILLPICAALGILFAADVAYSSKNPNCGKGITDYDIPPKAETSINQNPKYF